jgi:hypothetical protein
MESSDRTQKAGTPEWLARLRVSRHQQTWLLPLHDLGDDPIDVPTDDDEDPPGGELPELKIDEE